MNRSLLNEAFLLYTIPPNVSSFLSLIEYSLLDALNKVRSEEEIEERM